MAETSDAEGKAGERSESVAEPGLPTDVSVYGEYDPSVPGSHPRSLEWGCGADAAKNKPCLHPEVQFTGARRCLHCQSANSDCVGSGCRACAACRSRKSTCSFVKSRRRKVAGGEASGSGGAGIREVGTGVRGRGRRTPGTAARETPRATRASTTATALPILRPSHVDRELRDLHQTLANLESWAAALNAAQAELNRIRTATLANLGAAILRREQQWAEAADLAEREENDGADEGEEEIDEDGAEWAICGASDRRISAQITANISLRVSEAICGASDRRISAQITANISLRVSEAICGASDRRISAQITANISLRVSESICGRSNRGISARTTANISARVGRLVGDRTAGSVHERLLISVRGLVDFLRVSRLVGDRTAGSVHERLLISVRGLVDLWAIEPLDQCTNDC
ncbi:hypothetical protein EYR38_000906 [Pleurotus pulmonarius]|nr:hypothetical protein EYR38_000906 [Pleurotus pulmonarius]